MPNLATKYEPTEHEPRIRERWESTGAFHATPDPVLRAGRPPYCILIPPPNVTDRLHLGHALNNSLQDVLIRVHRMMGFEALWLPGTDHAGIATQTKVERHLVETEKKRRTDYRRDEFVARVQAWKDEFEQTITNQLKLIGCSCDWQRQRFTMDPVCAAAVREAFYQLFKAGLIYRGKRLVNWDPVTQTALADDEVEMKEVEGKFYYLRYPLTHTSGAANGQPVTWSELAARGYPSDLRPQGLGAEDDDPAFVTVATTRPETYLGDTAVAVNPADPRARALEGLSAQLPLVGRIVPIIEDEYVVLPDPDSQDSKARHATGFLKVTPAHDPNDWEIGRRHDLPVINVMGPDGSISSSDGWTDIGDAGIFVGLSREAAREKVVKEFDARKLLESTRPHRHSVGHSYRSHVPIEPWLSDQWYVKVSDERLVGEAQRALDSSQRSTGTYAIRRDVKSDGALQFFPDRYAKTYEAWHDNLRDWCISRQLWWGHRIPAWRRPTRAAELPPDDAFGEFVSRLLAWQADDRIALQYRGEFVRLERIEKDSLDLTAFFVCVRDPEGSDREIVSFLESYGLEQDPDVLDTWFSSALWPLSTMGWPDPDAFTADELTGLLAAFNPTSVLCTGRDIITLWVSRMVMLNRFFKNKDLPFKHVYIHPIIQDGHGQRMSKSLGNGVDPLDIVHSHGADAMRLVLCQMATATQDVRMPVDLVCPYTGQTFEPEWVRSPAGYLVAAPIQKSPSDPTKEMVTAYGISTAQVRADGARPLARNSSSKFDDGRRFCTKLWNAARFTMLNLEESTKRSTETVTFADLTLIDVWMLSRIAGTVHEVEAALAEYQFSQYAKLMYDLLWRDFCDWYLEAVKPTVKQQPGQQAVLKTSLDCILRMLHPICPFITEALYEGLRTYRVGAVKGIDLADAEVLCRASWPRISSDVRNPEAEQSFERMRSLVETIRTVRSQQQIEPRRKVVLHVDQPIAELIAAAGGFVETLAGLEAISTTPADSDFVNFTFESRAHALSGLHDALDAGAEADMLEKKLSKLDREIGVLEGRLNNPGYATKAPPHMVQETRDQLAGKQAERTAIENRLKELV